jgi:hypothetical protein
MDPAANTRATAEEVVSFARDHGVDLERYCRDGLFQKDQRWIFLWRKDELPWSGRTGEEAATLHYNMQGEITRPPPAFQRPSDAFHRAWSEAGTLESVGQAFALMKAWLLDGNEVDELPQRSARRSGIG